jgi:hypothetical protein
MYGAGREASREALDLWLRAAEDDLMSRRIVGHHADDNVAAEQSGEVMCRPDAKRFKRICAPGLVQIADDGATARDEISSHGTPHMTEADEADGANLGLAGLLFLAGGLLNRHAPGSFPSKRTTRRRPPCRELERRS